jgi:hypothetical protein
MENTDLVSCSRVITNLDDRVVIDNLRSILKQREQELLDLKGPCSAKSRGCNLHYAHSGPCDIERRKS